MSEERAEASSAETPWYDGLDDEHKGHIQNKGWDKMAPGEAAAAMARAHREAERRLGIPPNEVLRVPSKADDAGWDTVWERLGAPKEATAYDLAPIKFKDGGDLDDGFAELMRGTAHKLHLSPNAAQDMTRAFVSFMEEAEVREAAEAAVVAEQEGRKLDANWGNMKEANTFIAKQAIERLGLPKEFGETLQRQVGYADAMEAFRKLGMMMQEPGFVGGQGATAPAAMSREQAIMRLEELKSDAVWFKRFYDGDVLARAEFERLCRVSGGGPL